MKKNSVIIIIIFILCFSITGCRNRDNLIKPINAEYFTITYGKSGYEAKDKVKQETVDLLVKDYNNIKFEGTTSQELNYDKAITIIFINNDKISGQLTIDDKGICWMDNNVNTYIVNKKSNVYLDLLKVYYEVKGKYKS
ncbi:hypothetical protein LL037_25185 (plasmid) [Clostridium estertheticum]|uniref:hypothetical protein n=1 Tax=Clostridium estertheticum TaxID=238834 RepID=UPI001C0C5737|nr:hypothetical protein [Clostridium estertheticum]MBU3201801.1 hypothetical protein [Clostridium estertheticum]WAG68194.1 hypothetical protein LL037_25185 [Clostridium estertheticum]